jgi:hypothetical protein
MKPSSPQRRLVENVYDSPNSDDTRVPPKFFVGIVKPGEDPGSLPPLKPDHVRLLHRTSPQLAEKIKVAGLDYGKYGPAGLHSTATAFSDASQIEWETTDPRFKNSYIVVMDLPMDEFNKRTRQRSVGVRRPVPSTPPVLPSPTAPVDNDVW